MQKPENAPLSTELAQRKESHLELAARAQLAAGAGDERFNYEPLFFHHPKCDERWPVRFLGKDLNFPLWISSMTGGSASARAINENLARLCGKHRLGMGLGSCRPLLHDPARLEDFALRRFLGDQPFFANLGIAQLDELLAEGKLALVHGLVHKLEASGLIIHLNPLQEWLQPEGDRFQRPPLETLQRFLEGCTYPVIVKEVGQGMGPRSLKALLELPIKGIEFGALGGTNFSLLESLRTETSEHKRAFVNVGHTALEMVGILNALPLRDKEFIISGGLSSVLDGYELLGRFKGTALIGLASAWLGPATRGMDALEEFFLSYTEALLTARGALTLKGDT